MIKFSLSQPGLVPWLGPKRVERTECVVDAPVLARMITFVVALLFVVVMILLGTPVVSAVAVTGAATVVAGALVRGTAPNLSGMFR